MLHRSLFIAGCLTLLAIAQADAQTPRPGRLTKEEQAALRPGLTAEFFAPGKFDRPLDSRVVRLAAIHVPKGQSPTPFIPPGPFTLRLRGYVKAPLKGKYTLHAHFAGEASLRVAETTVDFKVKRSGLDPWHTARAEFDLAKGYNPIEVIFHSPPANQDAVLRLSWSSDDFVEEPLPPEALFTRGDDAELIAGLALREGRELFATRSCAKCHTLQEKLDLTPREGAMPELAYEAPSLAGVGSRLNGDWLRAWIVDPTSMRPTATMPRVLHGNAKEQAQQAADIAAYLATLVDEPAKKPPPAGTDEQIAEGVKLWENLGCVACHSTKPLTEEDPFARRSLHFVKAKFAPGQLAEFLQAPHKHYAFSRMPDFKLNAEEATSLAALLQSRAAGVTDAPHVQFANRGKALFTSAGCASCHRVDEKPPGAAKLIPLSIKAAEGKGCLAEDAAARGTSPHFPLTPAQRAALTTFLKTDKSSLARETPAEYSLRQVATLNCLACHRRDGQNSVLSNVLTEEGEQGLTPEILPLLTWTGEKLQPAWTEKLLAGHLDSRARPWLKARMPSFGARGKLIAAGLSHEHGFGISENPRPNPDAALAKIGAGLAGEMNGFNCIKCHSAGKQPALQPFEAPGINLASAAERLRYSYYPRWMLDPPRVDVAVKMPKFAADGKTTGVTTVLDGDAAKQYEALWHYIQSLK